VDYKRDETARFISIYADKYKVFPEKYSFIGFDVCHYYMSLLHKHGTRFELEMSKEKQTYFHYSFDFFKTGIESGYENTSMRLLKYSEFEISELSRAN